MPRHSGRALTGSLGLASLVLMSCAMPATRRVVALPYAYLSHGGAVKTVGVFEFWNPVLEKEVEAVDEEAEGWYFTTNVVPEAGAIVRDCLVDILNGFCRYSISPVKGFRSDYRTNYDFGTGDIITDYLALSIDTSVDLHDMSGADIQRLGRRYGVDALIGGSVEVFVRTQREKEYLRGKRSSPSTYLKYQAYLSCTFVDAATGSVFLDSHPSAWSDVTRGTEKFDAGAKKLTSRLASLHGSSSEQLGGSAYEDWIVTGSGLHYNARLTRTENIRAATRFAIEEEVPMIASELGRYYTDEKK